MARKIAVAGTVTGIPNVYQDRIELEGGAKPGVLESGVVCLVGLCEGTIQPKVPHVFRSSLHLKSLLGGGDLYDACRFAFDPSREEPGEVRGAQKVIAVRVNPAAQGFLTLNSPTKAPLVDLSSVAYGAKANQISVLVEDGSLGGSSKKLIIRQFGENDEVGDNLGFFPVFLMRYTGNASAATLSIDRNRLTTLLTGAADGSQPLNIEFSVLNTVAKLVNYINAQSGYEAVAITNKANSYLCQDLDYVNKLNIKTAVGTISMADDVSEDLTIASGLSGLAVGDVLRVEASGNSEYLYVNTVGAKNKAIRGYLDSIPVKHVAATAQVFYAVSGVNQAVIEWISTYSSRLYATRNASNNIGTIHTLRQTFLSGGSEGTTANSDWQKALDAVRSWKYNFIVLTSPELAPQGYLKTHLAHKWGLLGQEAIGHIGMPKDATKAQIKTRAKALQSANLYLWFADCNREDDTGVDANYPPWALAAMASGIQAGSAIGTPLTWKSLNVTSIGYNPQINLDDDAEDFIDYGVCIARYDGNEYRIIRALSTWSNSDPQHLISPNNRSALAWTVYKVREWVRLRHIGKKALSGNALSIKTTVMDALDECRDKDEAIVEGSKRVGGRIVRLPAYSDVVVLQNGNVAEVSYKCIPVDGTDFVIVKTTVAPYQDVA